MTAPTVGTEADRYLQRVRAALADLPEDERNELIEDLSAHLADISAESPGTLTAASLEERLGRPEAYAAELRASAGLAPAPRATAQLRGITERVRGRLDAVPAYRQFVAFLPELRPGWWVLRGYLFAVVVAAIFLGGFSGVLPSSGSDAVVFLVLAALAAYGSVWLGRRSDGFGRWGRRAVIAGGIFVALVGLAIVTTSRSADYYDTGSYYSGGPLSDATDLRVYGPDGQLIRDAQVFDQNGNPVVLSGSCPTEQRTRTDGGVAENVYPRTVDPSIDPAYCTDDGRAPVAEQLPGLNPRVPTAGGVPVSPGPSSPGPGSPVPSESVVPSGSSSPTGSPSGSPAASSAAPTPTPTR
ncbi:DUF1700 domain-containing protein [Cryptosporangium japonicum]|uniref:Proline-rich protein n=1 Tax=Cryptosporangium japonicum TaxID=80872 RepID=A0ABN0UYD8_9ACTN